MHNLRMLSKPTTDARPPLPLALLAGLILTALCGPEGRALAQEGKAAVAKEAVQEVQIRKDAFQEVQIRVAPALPAQPAAVRRGAVIQMRADVNIDFQNTSTRPAQVATVPQPVAPTNVPVIFLTNGGFAAGALRDSAQASTLSWQATPFVSPFSFELNSINSVHYPAPTEPVKPSGEYCIELAGGDLLYGALADLSDREATLDLPRLGRIQVERGLIRRISRWKSADVIYNGPNGLLGWKEPASTKGWREESGQAVSDVDGTSISGEFGLPALAAVEVELSWKNKPDFLLALGTDDQEKSIKQAFRFEIWDKDLVAFRETERESDLTSLREVSTGPGRAQFQVYLDQTRGRMLVFSTSGRQLADIQARTDGPRPLGGVYLSNKKGDVRLERLRISHWNGEAPREASADKARVHLADGSIVYGQVTKYDAAKGEFLVRGESGESRLTEAKISSVYLSLPTEDAPRGLRVVYQDGSRVSGELARVEKGDLWMNLPGVKGTTRLPGAGLRSLIVLRHDAKPAPSQSKPAGIARLEMDGLNLQGHLSDGREGPESSCLAWQPIGSSTASALRSGNSGRVVYREPPPPPPALTQQQIQQQQMVRQRQLMVQQQQQGMQLGVAQRTFRALSTPEPPPTKAKRTLYLRTGDMIPCDVTRIDEEGVTFRTPLSDVTFVPHDKIKAVELAAETAISVRLNKPKRERLLTLPRMQKDSPPTQLIRSKNGDFLRGRVIAMDDKNLQVEVRLETKEVPRDRVSRIIWLHPEEIDPTKNPPKPAVPGAGTRVQAVRPDGIRLTFTADQFADSTLSGKSDVLGPCRVAFKEVDQFIFGQSIEKAAEGLVYGQWKLHSAPEPRAATDDPDSPGGRAGTEAALVGKPAPDFKLDLVGGKNFHLADAKGKVVILDFWATWCGPCIQAMPQVDKVAHEFADKGVELVAVNLQEGPEQITAMLDRHKLKMTVALDRDGAIAEKYGASAIPQTVIINRDGTVARVFVGGGPHFDDELRDALKAVLGMGEGKPAPK
jgi:peroxiredoxin